MEVPAQKASTSHGDPFKNMERQTDMMESESTMAALMSTVSEQVWFNCQFLPLQLNVSTILLQGNTSVAYIDECIEHKADSL